MLIPISDLPLQRQWVVLLILQILNTTECNSGKEGDSASMKKMLIIAIVVMLTMCSVADAQLSILYDYNFIFGEDRAAFFTITDPNRSYDYAGNVPMSLSVAQDIQTYLEANINFYYELIKLSEYPESECGSLPELQACIADPNCDEGVYVPWSRNNPPYNETIDAINADASISTTIKTILKKLVKIEAKERGSLGD